MKYLQMVFISFLFIFALGFVTTGTNNLVSADDDDDERYEQREGGDGEEAGPYEEIGENAGWGTVIAMGTPH